MQLGFTSMLGIGVSDETRGYLLEMYSQEQHHGFTALAPVLTALAHYCVNVTRSPRIEG